MKNYLDLFGYGARVMVAIAFYSLGISKASAQEEERQYVPFVEEGKAWYCGYNHPGVEFPQTAEDPEGRGIDCIFTMRGDTLIGDREYKKVFCQFEEYYGDGEQHYYCAVREESYRVFIIEEKSTEERLIYDFSTSEKLITVTYNEYTFARTGGGHRYGFLPGQLEYSVCKFTDDEVDYSNDSSSWIDGVGAPLNNPFAFELRFLPFNEPKLGKDIIVLTCMKDGKYLYMLEWMDEPMEPLSIDDRNHADNYQKDSHLYDLQGRRVGRDLQSPTGKPLRRGLYIKDGKKVVIK